jgi:hypothetical protein
MNTNSKVGGILSIVAGGIGVLKAAYFLVWTLFMGGMFVGIPELREDPEAAPVMLVFGIIFFVAMVFTLALGAVSIVGGIFALKRRRWGWALAGSICACLSFIFCGVPAIIFICLGRDEFADVALLSPAFPGGNRRG